MTLAELLLAEMNREVERSRRALEQVPPGQYDWKPHDRSMTFGYLAHLVAVMPQWIEMIVTRPELDIAPAEGSSALTPERRDTSEAFLRALDEHSTAARTALQHATDDVLQQRWQLKARGKVVQDTPRLEAIQDTINHWVHHRGQMTVYLRLLGAKVPSIYGPSADDPAFR